MASKITKSVLDEKAKLGKELKKAKESRGFSYSEIVKATGIDKSIILSVFNASASYKIETYLILKQLLQ
jgi:transcriptional regulator with XRE-family HTH domain